MSALERRVADALPSPLATPIGEGRLLGRDLAFPFGIAASAATKSPDLIRYFAQRGFNVLTFKTVRSREWGGNPDPTWIHLDDPSGPLDPGAGGLGPYERAAARGSTLTSVVGRSDFSDANSYGVPSPAPEVWQGDLAEAVAAVGSGQLLIASVQGSPETCSDRPALVADFVHVAQLAADAGATAVELNLSCPNVLEADGGAAAPLCDSPSLVGEVVAAVRQELRGDVALIAKLSYLTRDRMAAVLEPIVVHCDAVAGVNTLAARVQDENGAPFFPGREVAGVSGVALRDLARDFVASVVEVRGSQPLEVIAMGGVAGADDARILFELGADAVQSVTAAVAEPGLAFEVAQALAAPVAA